MQSLVMARHVVVAVAVLSMLSMPDGARAGQVGGLPDAPIQPGRDRPPAPRSGTGVLKGRVVDGATGAGIARARVRLQGNSGPSPTQLTGGNGDFAFSNLPPGRVMLSVEKSTYMPGRYPEAGRTVRAGMRALVLGAGQVLEGVTVALFHGGAIAGRVADETGDPVEYAQVRAIRVPAPGRGGRPMMTSGSESNDLGEFRVPRLEPGSYLLQVLPSHRFAMNEPLREGQQPEPQALPTFYPGALSADGAQPIIIARGQSVTEIDVTLVTGLPAVLSGTVLGEDGVPAANGFVSVRSVAAGVGGDSTGTGIDASGAFNITLAPGDYHLEARIIARPAAGAMGPAAPGNELVGSMRVSLTGGGVEVVSIVVGRGATVSGRVVFEGNTPPPANPGQIHVPFYSEDGQGCRSGQARIAADWTFRVEGVSGTCSSPPSLGFGRWMLKALTYEGEDLLDKPFTFEPRRQLRDMVVVFTDKRTDLTFRVSDESGQSTRDYLALVFPTDKARWSTGFGVARLFASSAPQMTTGSGTLRAPGVAPARRESMSGLRPGEYYVVAVDDIEQEGMRDRVVLERLARNAVRVTLVEGVTVEAAVRRVKLEDALK